MKESFQNLKKKHIDSKHIDSFFNPTHHIVVTLLLL